MDKIGPIGRTVEDCAMVFEALRGPDGTDDAEVETPFNYDPSLDLTALRVGYLRDLNAAVSNRLASLVGPERLVRFTLPEYPYAAMSLVLELLSRPVKLLA